MNIVAFHAFSDELEKIAFLGSAADWAGKHLKNSWNAGSEGYDASVPKALHGWVGKGPEISAAMRQPGFGNTLRRGWQHTSGLGGLTKKLPVGSKALMLGFAAPGVYSAMKKHDATGRERSRLDRVTDIAGSTAGGLIGGSAGAAALSGFGRWGSGIGMLGGGILGATAGTALSGLPFSWSRNAVKRKQYAEYMKNMGQQAPAQEYQPQQYSGAV